jgi:hypothetical protein
MSEAAQSGQGAKGFIDWRPDKDSKELVEQILSVVHYYRDGGYPAPTVRDIYYRLLAVYGNSHGYKKDDAAFKRRIYRFLRQMRRVRSGPYKVEFSEINDDSFTSLVTKSFADPAEFWRQMKNQGRTYQKDLTANQPTRVIVFTEGAGEVRQFQRVARDYHVPVYSGGGWDSLNLKYETGRRAAFEHGESGRQTVVLHAGDFDPDGAWLFRCFGEDALAFAADLGAPHDVIVTRRVMLHAEQVPDYAKTPINRSLIKKMNHRGQQWPHDFKAELQGLDLPDRLRLMREAIEREVDNAQLEADRQESRQEFEEIHRDFERLSGDEEE